MSFSFLENLTERDKDDVFDSISCPNTFEDDSQVDQFFDTHRSTPSPKVRRSKRLKEKQNVSKENIPQPVKKVVEIKTPPKGSPGTSYASCSSSTPQSTPSFDMTKAATTPGPPPKSLLKLAIGNSLRKKAIDEDVTIVVAPKRTGPKTSTPRVVTKSVKTAKSIKENRCPGASQTPSTVKAQRPTVLTVNSKTVVKSEVTRTVVKRSISNLAAKSAARVAVNNTQRFVAPRVDLIASNKAASVKAKLNAGTSTIQQQGQKPKRSIGQKLAPERPVKRKSLKTIDKKKQNETKKTEVIKNRVAAARKAATENRNVAKSQKTVAGQYDHVKSKVAAMINSGPAARGRKVRDMKGRAADLKESKKALHDKPFIPPGKVKYNAAVAIVPGDLTVNGQTMAQFVKNFQYKTPPRYRTLKPTDEFKTTGVNHSVQSQNFTTTIAKSPKFATKDRRRNAVKKT